MYQVLLFKSRRHLCKGSMPVLFKQVLQNAKECLISQLFCGKIVGTSMYKATEKLTEYKYIYNAATLASSAKSLLALSNPVIFTVAHVEFVKCSREDGQSPMFFIPVEYSGR